VQAALPIVVWIVLNMDGTSHVQIPVVSHDAAQRCEWNIVCVNLSARHQTIALLTLVDSRVNIRNNSDQNVQEDNVRNYRSHQEQNPVNILAFVVIFNKIIVLKITDSELVNIDQLIEDLVFGVFSEHGFVFFTVVVCTVIIVTRQ